MEITSIRKSDDENRINKEGNLAYIDLYVYIKGSNTPPHTHTHTAVNRCYTGGGGPFCTKS